MTTPVGEWSSELGEVVGRLEEEVTEARLCLGVQLFVSVEGECLADVSLGENGLGHPNRSDTLYALYCTTKPLTVLALGRFVDDGRVDVRAELRSLLPGLSRRVGTITLWELLTHTAGLHHHTGFEAGLLGPARREQLVTTLGPPPHWERGVHAGYSEYGAWHLLGRVVERLSGEEFRSHVRRSVLEPLGLEDSLFLGMTAEEFAANQARIGVNVDLRKLGRTPFLFERTEAQCTDYNPGVGGRGCARGLGRLYEHLVDVHRGRAPDPLVSPSLLHELTAVHRPPVPDVVLGRVCAFGLGFMVGLRAHGFGHYCSETAFGHSGYSGLSCGFADPAYGLAVAITYNGFLDVQTSVLLRRQRISNLIYKAIGVWAPVNKEFGSAARSDHAY